MSLFSLFCFIIISCLIMLVDISVCIMSLLDVCDYDSPQLPLFSTMLVPTWNLLTLMILVLKFAKYVLAFSAPCQC